MNLNNSKFILNFCSNQSLKENKPSVSNKYPGHCGLYLGEENFIHASNYKGKIVISNFSKNEYWKRVMVASKNILSDEKVLEKVKK